MTTPRGSSVTFQFTTPSDNYDAGLPIGGMAQISGQTLPDAVTVDWGDGTVETMTRAGNWRHRYTTAGVYDATLTSEGGIPLPYREYPHPTWYTTPLTAVTTQNVTWYQYKNSTWGSPASLDYLFYSCANLMTVSGTIFKNCPNVTAANGVFNSCSKLQSIPKGLFDRNPLITSFSGTFRGCSQVERVPAGLFDHCPLVTNFTRCFQDCKLLRYSPDTIFGNNPLASNFSYCFLECQSFTIKSTIFSSPEDTTRFSTVSGCNFQEMFKRTIFYSGYQGTAPALWTYSFPDTPTSTNCFGGYGNMYVSLVNYNSIPQAWGGPA